MKRLGAQKIFCLFYIGNVFEQCASQIKILLLNHFVKAKDWTLSPSPIKAQGSKE
ncbi:uncharacterized protein PHALS_01891 [Plasmopara halstedii]|uniref:Uncharacterized protein n=1 Tax=Plasmopara halstedii TaxID=4781 RepID=A0A0P1AWU0_PLAHL|nr:uncharacterized protein PHALS_01891 [Plasmopara halstedii]CEG45604.1 hypothetical protein PHALS_01891 [Plasmopara halstedii]|eukprot:XP_024581973.1 hypothetical protein PHALS_01891 [Plasmopara halstedii]